MFHWKGAGHGGMAGTLGADDDGLQRVAEDELGIDQFVNAVDVSHEETPLNEDVGHRASFNPL